VHEEDPIGVAAQIHDIVQTATLRRTG
jgi:hypothetical protein